MTPRTFYRTAAIAEAVTWTLLLIGMFLKYITKTTDLGVSIAGGLHGFVFLIFCVATVIVAVDQRWSLSRMAFGLVAAIPPLATIPFEQWAVRKGLIGERWQLRERAPVSIHERVVAFAVSRPMVAGAVVAVGAAIIFGFLLTLGPPVQVDARG